MIKRIKEQFYYRRDWERIGQDIENLSSKHVRIAFRFSAEEGDKSVSNRWSTFEVTKHYKRFKDLFQSYHNL